MSIPILINGGMARLGGCFGVGEPDPLWRHARLLGTYACLYAACAIPLPGLPLVLLCVGYVGVVAIGHTWTVNEKTRTLMVRKLVQGCPDALPDLRLTAALSALQLVVLFPLLFLHCQRHFQLFDAPPTATLWTWLAFTFDSCCKGLLNATEIYDVQFTSIRYDSAWGRHLVLLKRITFDYVLIQGLLRLIEARRLVHEGVSAVKQDADLAARLGRRGVPALLRCLRSEDAVLRRQVAVALGKIGDARAAEALHERLADPDDSVRAAAAAALGALGDRRAIEPLIGVLRKEHSEKTFLTYDREQAAETLVRLGGESALAALIEALHGPRRQAAAAAARALALLGEECGLTLLAQPNDTDDRSISQCTLPATSEVFH